MCYWYLGIATLGGAALAFTSSRGLAYTEFVQLIPAKYGSKWGEKLYRGGQGVIVNRVGAVQSRHSGPSPVFSNIRQDHTVGRPGRAASWGLGGTAGAREHLIVHWCKQFSNKHWCKQYCKKHWCKQYSKKHYCKQHFKNHWFQQYFRKHYCKQYYKKYWCKQFSKSHLCKQYSKKHWFKQYFKNNWCKQYSKNTGAIRTPRVTCASSTSRNTGASSTPRNTGASSTSINTGASSTPRNTGASNT